MFVTIDLAFLLVSHQENIDFQMIMVVLMTIMVIIKITAVNIMKTMSTIIIMVVIIVLMMMIGYNLQVNLQIFMEGLYSLILDI